MYVNSLACVRVKGGKSDCFRIESCAKQDYVISSWLFNAYIDTIMKKVKAGMGIMGVRFLEEEREWRLPSIVYADDCVLGGKSEEDLKVVVRVVLLGCVR